MILKNFLTSIGKHIGSKVVIMEGNKELYNNYLDKLRVYKYLEGVNIKTVYASDNDIIIGLEPLEIKREYFFEHPVILGIVPVDNQEFIDKLNGMDLIEGQKVSGNPHVYVKAIQENGTIILSGRTKYNP